jgi:hypothetical protein
LKKVINSLKELETISKNNSKIGLRTIANTIDDFKGLEDEVSMSVSKLDSNFITEE